MYYFTSMMVVLYVNDGRASIKCNKQQEKYLCFKGKYMHFRHRQNRDRTGSDRTGSRIGSRIGSQKKKF